MRECSNPKCRNKVTSSDKRTKYCSRSCSAIVNNSKFPKRGSGDTRFCFCGKMLTWNQKSYCSRKHAAEGRTAGYISEWLAGNNSGSHINGGISSIVRNYLLGKSGNRCSRCGWGEPNPKLGRPILTIDHIDGNWKNNAVDNLVVLCYNCHTLTPTFNALNIGNGAGVRGSGNRMYAPLE